MRWRLLPSLAFFTQHPCCTTYFLPTAAKSKQKMPLAKICSSSNYQENFYIVLIHHLCKHFKLVNHTSLMTGTQSRHPCRAIQLGEAVLLKKPVSPMQIALQNSPDDWRTYMRG